MEILMLNRTKRTFGKKIGRIRYFRTGIVTFRFVVPQQITEFRRQWFSRQIIIASIQTKIADVFVLLSVRCICNARVRHFFLFCVRCEENQNLWNANRKTVQSETENAQIKRFPSMNMAFIGQRQTNNASDGTENASRRIYSSQSMTLNRRN